VWRQTLAKARDRRIEGRLSWVLATHPDTRIRNGAEALRLATNANQAAMQPEAWLLDVLAAAHAENGDYTEAAAAARQAAALAERAGLAEMMAEISSRAKLYEQQKPYRESKINQRQ
jgi:hypothetical protein